MKTARQPPPSAATTRSKAQLIVNVSEFYSQLHFPVSGYEAYRKVVNAAADFNKITLLLTNQ